MSFLDDVGRVKWADFKDAYGPASGMAEALAVLASESDPDSDDWQDAINGTLLAHVWHQSDIYPVTAQVVPFLIQLLGMPLARPADVGHALCLMADSAARYASEPQPERVAIGQATMRAVADHADTVLGWLHGPNAEIALFLGSRLPALHEGLLAALEPHAIPSWQALVALAGIERLPAWVLDRAHTALVAEDELVRLAAAVLLLRRGGGEPADVIARIVGDDTVRRLNDGLAMPFEIVLVRPEGEAVERAGTVLFAGPRMVVAKLDDGGNVTIHWADSGVAKGTRLTIGVTPDGKARWVDAGQGRIAT